MYQQVDLDQSFHFSSRFHGARTFSASDVLIGEPRYLQNDVRIRVNVIDPTATPASRDLENIMRS